MIARHFRWNSEAMETVWFEKKSKLELELGIVYDTSIAKKTQTVNASLPANNQGYCNSCYEENLSTSNQFSLSCQHTFCKGCWSNHLETKIDSGIEARCMQSGCNIKVGHSVFETFFALNPKMLEFVVSISMHFCGLQSSTFWDSAPFHSSTNLIISFCFLVQSSSKSV